MVASPAGYGGGAICLDPLAPEKPEVIGEGIGPAFRAGSPSVPPQERRVRCLLPTPAPFMLRRNAASFTKLRLLLLSRRPVGGGKRNPRGRRCWTCHPRDHLPLDDFTR